MRRVNREVKQRRIRKKKPAEDGGLRRVIIVRLVVYSFQP